jgi:hypothetical protein
MELAAVLEVEVLQVARAITLLVTQGHAVPTCEGYVATESHPAVADLRNPMPPRPRALDPDAGLGAGEVYCP